MAITNNSNLSRSILRFSVLASGAAAICQCSLAAARSKAVPSKPNIIFIMADDLGWTDLGIMGSDFYETPNIDRLASEGLLFTNAYSSAANSAPSRACLISGLYTPRHGIYTVNPSERGDASKRRWIPIKTEIDLDPQFYTIAEALKDCGYSCGHVGKWHLGDDKDGSGPLSQGFDFNVGGNRAGAPYSYFYPYKNKKGNVHLGLSEGKEGEYLTDRLTDEAISFIKSRKDTTFFLYLPHYAVHKALQAPDSLIDKYRNKAKGQHHANPVYAAMIERLDYNVGRLCDVLDDLGLRDNTILIFTSDNGGLVPVTDNYPLRGGKGNPYEGGIRVPLIIRWPGHVPAGSTSDQPVINIDFYPTFLNICGGNVKVNLDGKDIFKTLSGKGNRDIFWHFPAYLESYIDKSGFRATPYSIIRSGNWKLIHQYEYDTYELYDLESDPSEEKNLIDENPLVARKLKKKLAEWVRKTDAPIPNELNPKMDHTI